MGFILDKQAEMAGGLSGADALSVGASVAGGLLGRHSARKARIAAENFQRSVLQNQLQWRAADAKAAGLHPLAALGASVSGGGTTAVGDTGSWVSEAGQNLSRALSAGSSQRVRALDSELAQVSLENAKLQGDFIREQIASSQQKRMQAANPSVAVPSVGDPHAFEFKPSEVAASAPGVPSLMAGPANPAYQSVNFGPFKLNLLSPTVSEVLDDMEMAKYGLTYMENKEVIDSMFQDAVGRYLEPSFRWFYENVERPYTATKEQLEKVYADLDAWAQKAFARKKRRPYTGGYAGARPNRGGQ